MLWAAGDTRNPMAGLLVFDGYSVKATPEIPRSDRPPWSPRLRDCNHLIGTWANAIVEVTGDRLLDTDVRNGKHVRSQQVKYQEHLSSPTADPFHLDEAFYHRIVVHSMP